MVDTPEFLYGPLLDQIKLYKDTALILENDNYAATTGKLKTAFKLRAMADELKAWILKDAAERGLDIRHLFPRPNLTVVK